MRPNLARWLLSLPLLVALAAPAAAQVVELNPVPLSGTIRIGDWEILSLTIRADSSVGHSTVGVPVAPGTVEASYSTIVQVPAGGSAFYRITITAGLRSPDGSYGVSFQYQYPPTVAVEDGVPATLDFIADPPTLVRATVTALPGELLEQASARAEHTSGFPFAVFQASVSAPPGGAETLSFDLPVGSGVDLLCSGGARMTNGRGAALEPFQVVTVPEGGVGSCDFTPEEPPLTGGIRGAIDYAGEVPVDEYGIYANRRGGGNRPDPITLLPPFVPGPANYAEYEFSDVELAHYDVNALVELEGGQQRLSFELGQNVGVSEDTTTVLLGGELCQATILSPFELGGISAREDWDFGPEPADPVVVVRLGDFGGSSQPHADPRDAPVRMLVRDGTWSQRMSFGIRRDRFTPAGFANTSVSRMIFQENIGVECGETVTTPVRVLETGRIEVQFRVAGGGFLQNPIIQGSCSHPDASGEEIYRYDVTAYSANPGPSVQLGIVPVEAPAGICNFTATARVNGVNVSFGALNDLEIEPGVEIVIGLEGTRIQITSPADGATVDAEEIPVTGIASDDGEVVSVVVNGVTAALTPTGNPDDPHEVAFTATVPIESGDNLIAAVATDDDGNETEASLHIENLMPPPPNDPPSIAITSPAPGSAVEGDFFVVEGIASDDVGVVSVSVSGFPATLTPTGNPDDPNEVAFSATVYTAILPPGVLSTITAVAQDERGEQSTATLEVERVLPPLPCDANGDYVVDITDIALIFAARGSAAEGPDDPRDVNGDGLITVNDGRLCVFQCTNYRCAPEDDD
jgi:hypothetical protein